MYMQTISGTPVQEKIVLLLTEIPCKCKQNESSVVNKTHWEYFSITMSQGTDQSEQ